MSAATWDQTNFNNAMREAARFTRRTPAQAVNVAAFHVTLFWINEMEKVPIERMDYELAATLKRTKSGRLSRAKNAHAVVKMGGHGVQDVPLAVLIIQARANPASKYNILTGGRWAGPSPYKGVSRAAGRQAMRAAVSRMIKSRHRSSAFLASSMLPAADDLRPWAKGGRGGAPPIGRQGVKQYGAEKGGALPAIEGNPVAVCVIYSNIGLFGAQARGQHEAIWNFGGPAMQRALDKGAFYQMQYVLEKEWAEFNRKTAAFR